MENFDEHIENEYRKRFDDFEEMPDDLLWKSIQARIKPEKERPLIVWLNAMRGPTGIAASVLIGLLIGAYFLINRDQTQQISDLPDRPDTNISQPGKPDVTPKSKLIESEAKTESKLNNAMGKEPEKSAPANANKRQRLDNSIASNHQSSDKNNSEAVAQIPIEKKVENKEENKNAVAVKTTNPESGTGRGIVADNKESDEEKAVLANTNKNNVNEDAKTIAEEQANKNILAATPKQTLPGQVVLTDEENHSAVLKDTLFQRINPLSGKEAQQLAVTEKKINAPELPAAEIPVIETEEKRRLVFIPPTEVFANVTSTLSYYMFAPNKGDQVLVQNFSSSSQRLGFAAQLGFVYPLAKKMDLRTGLSYFSGKSRISYGVTDNSMKSVTVLNDNSIQINPGNATKNENRNWQYFELQSDILYEVRKMQALSLGMKFGVQTSAINKPLLQARVGYRVSKAIAQHWALWLEPTVSVSLSSHHSIENLFMYRTTGLGLNMGVSLLR